MIQILCNQSPLLFIHNNAPLYTYIYIHQQQQFSMSLDDDLYHSLLKMGLSPEQIDEIQAAEKNKWKSKSAINTSPISSKSNISSEHQKMNELPSQFYDEKILKQQEQAFKKLSNKSQKILAMPNELINKRQPSIQDYQRSIMQKQLSVGINQAFKHLCDQDAHLDPYFPQSVAKHEVRNPESNHEIPQITMSAKQLKQQQELYQKLTSSKQVKPESLQINNAKFHDNQDQFLRKLVINSNPKKQQVTQFDVKQKSPSMNNFAQQVSEPPKQKNRSLFQQLREKQLQKYLQKLQARNTKTIWNNVGVHQPQQYQPESDDFGIQDHLQVDQDPDYFDDFNFNEQENEEPKMFHKRNNPVQLKLNRQNLFDTSMIFPSAKMQDLKIKSKSKQQDMAILLTGQQAQISKMYAIFDNKYYGLSNIPVLKVALNTANMGFVQFHTLDSRYKIQISLHQIEHVAYSKHQNLIFLNIKNPMRWFQKLEDIGWDRMPNICAFNQTDNTYIFGSVVRKQMAIQIRPTNLDQMVKELRRVCRSVHEQNQIQRMLIKQKLEYLFQKYNQKKFERLLEKYTNKDFAKSQQMKFSLFSLLFTCHSINIKHIFALAQNLNELYDVSLIDVIWKTVIAFTSRTIHGQIRSSQDLISQFRGKLENNLGKKLQNQSTQNMIRVSSFKLTPSGIVPAGWSYDTRNRLFRQFRKYDFQFIKIEVTDDDLKSKLFQCRQSLKSLFEQLLENVDFFLNTYIPLGWTQSQLKNCSIWYTLVSSKTPFIQRDELINFLGEFSQFDKNPALKAARIGQNLSNGSSVDVSGAKYQIVNDNKNYNGRLLFTDGIGSISTDLVQKIQKKLGNNSNIFQVRYLGCKGILVTNKFLPPNTIQLRQSMKKFECRHKDASKYLDILARNTYGVGLLNRQIIILLNANKISKNAFFQLQRQFINAEIMNKNLYQNFRNSLEDDKQQSFQIETIGEVMNKIVKKKPNLVVLQPTLRGVLTEKHITMFERLIQKHHIRVQKSARLLGIIDEYGILQQNQVYCQITKNEEKAFVVSGRAMLTRNPCMHPADIRVVRCISKAEATKRFQQLIGADNFFDELTNCIIFPAAGKIPLTSQISGSDLDGDQFFISWDQRLIPDSVYAPNIVDSIKVADRIWSGTGHDQMIKFFCEFIFNDQLGRLGNCHLIWADRYGASCQHCLELCTQYAKAVDYPKKGYQFKFDKKYWVTEYPHFMQKSEKETYRSTSVLGQLHDQSKREYDRFLKSMNELNYQHVGVKNFKHQNYSDGQIKAAAKIVQNYCKDINRITRSWKLKREFQFYCLRSTDRVKINKEQFYERSNLQTKYFNKFFNGLIKQGEVDPIQFYTLIRNGIMGMSSQTERKLALWYQISSTSILKKQSMHDKNVRDWLYKLQRVSEIDLNNLNFVGLTWFCLPSLMLCLIFKQN